jgi:uncharacterized protein (DUF1697 family)
VASVVLLRGINVGGHRRFRPKALADDLRHLDVVNIGAAGTLVVRDPIGEAALRREVAARLPFDGAIVICPGRDVIRLASHDWFAAHPVRADLVRFVSVLAALPRSRPRLPLDLPSGGPWLVKVLARRGRFVMGVHRRQMKAIGCLGALDGTFGVPLTTRSWTTIAAIARVLDGADSRPT